MNRKLLAIVLALAVVLLATPMLGTVMAGKRQEKLSIKFTVGSYDPSTQMVEKGWNSPKKVEFPAYGRITHFRGGDWGDPEAHVGFMIVVDEGGANEETFDDEDIAYSCIWDVNYRNAAYGDEMALPYVVATIKVRETWEIEGRGYMEIITTDKISDALSLYEGMSSEGSFVGHGMIDGQMVKLSGDSMFDGDVYRVGTVMGWP